MIGGINMPRKKTSVNSKCKRNTPNEVTLSAIEEAEELINNSNKMTHSVDETLKELKR